MKNTPALLILAALPALGQTPVMPAPAPGKIDFDTQIQPILESKCYGCHGLTKQLAGLRLDRRQLALRGGDYGKVILPGDSANSKLIHRLIGSQAGMQMPPSGPLEPHEISLLRAWIDQGPDYGKSQLTARERPPKPVLPGWNALLGHIVAGDLDALRAALSADKALAAAADPAGATALHHAAGRGSLAAMNLLLDAGAPIDAPNGRGSTPLVWALADPEKTKLLIARGASANSKNREGRTPLHVAAQQSNQAATFRLLLASGADPNVADVAGITPLHIAATAGSEPFTRALLAAGAKVNAVSGNGSTPLLFAAMSGSSPTVATLLDHGADPRIVTKRNVSPLAAAASWGDVDILTRLIAKGAPVSLADSEGWTPLAFAAYSEHAGLPAVQLLLAKGATPQANQDGETPAQLAAKRGAAEIVAALNAAPPSARVRDAVTRAFAPLVQQSPNFVRIGGCNSCHNQDLPVFAQRIARERGIPAGEPLALAPETADSSRIFEHSGLLGSSLFGYQTMSLVGRNRPADAQTDAMVNYLLAHQEPDGRWFSRSNRQPFAGGDHHATAFAIFTLRSFARNTRLPEARQSIARGVAWLQEHAPASNQDAAMQVMGMAWGNADRDALAAAAATLARRQTATGGWSQLPGLAPDAYATGQSLYALALAGTPPASESFSKGVDFLLRTQAPDGTWRVKARSKPLQPYFESGFPYGVDQFISAAGTSWAAMALSMAVDTPLASARR